MDPTNPTDATEDPDNDGGWDCSGDMLYVRYNNFKSSMGLLMSAFLMQLRKTTPCLIVMDPLLRNGGNSESIFWASVNRIQSIRITCE